MSNKSCPVLHRDLLYENGQDFSYTQYRKWGFNFGGEVTAMLEIRGCKTVTKYSLQNISENFTMVQLRYTINWFKNGWFFTSSRLLYSVRHIIVSNQSL